MNVYNHNARRGVGERSETYISNVIDWMFVPCLSLTSILSYVGQGTKETGNIYLTTLA